VGKGDVVEGPRGQQARSKWLKVPSFVALAIVPGANFDPAIFVGLKEDEASA
jgi:hypothetical protein